MPGPLYIVSTPIGNLEDITLRALRILRDVAVIAAEDTRHTAGLLRRYDIRTPTTSFHEHNEREKTPRLLARLEAGDAVALVSDSGTPGVSDPGYRLVRAARDAGCMVLAIPGPSAVLAALVSSGFPTDSFTFLGFPPRKPTARREWLARLAAEPRTVVFFEAPHRIRETLQDLTRLYGERPICVAKELTKAHEITIVGPADEAINRLNAIKGEYTIVVPPSEGTDALEQTPSDQDIDSFVGHTTEKERLSKRRSITRAARHFGMTPGDVYAALERAKKQRIKPAHP
jgi:16S rRNA (cytidine1402-2'-O)-methyltransferase